MTWENIVEEDVRSLFRQVFATLTPGVATLEVASSQDPAGGEDIVLRPSNPGSALIWCHALDRTIVVGFGNSVVEMFANYRAETRALDRIRQMAEAVINGDFSEEVWSINGRVVKVVGVMQIHGKAIKLRYSRLYNPFRLRERRRYCYAPYKTSQ